MTDAQQRQRSARRLIVEIKIAQGAPPNYSGWGLVYGCIVERIEINRDSSPSTAVIWFTKYRWNINPIFARRGNLVRIRTDEPLSADRSILFQGFIVSRQTSFSGGSDTGMSHERNVIVCCDYRWLLNVTSPVVGQFARSRDDYYLYGTYYQYPKDNNYTFLSGRRVVFNEKGLPNKDPAPLILTNYDIEMPVFIDSDSADHWTARDMLNYCLSPLYNRVYNIFPLIPSNIASLEHSDFDRVLNNILVDGLSNIEAAELVVKHIGWSFRQDYDDDGKVTLVFFKVGSAAGYTRTDEQATILHKLHAPAVGEDISAAVAEGSKMLWSMALDEDIRDLVNQPWGLGAPHRFEFTAELVPAWLDSELVPDTTDELANLYFIESDLQDFTDPNLYSYYKYYHPRGSQFLRGIGRQWTLNESGRYSAGSYDRGMPFDFATVINAGYILDSDGKRLYAPFKRQLLSCLTLDKDSLNTIGIKVEFSFDGGATWQILPASISSLGNECGIYIDEPNLAEMVDEKESLIVGGDLDGVQLNYWTSLCDDKLNGRSFKNSQWRTRVRVTASVQLDERLGFYVGKPSYYGSPFPQINVYDFSNKYGIAKRTSASSLYNSGLPAKEVDSTYLIIAHLEAIRKASQDPSVSGVFVLERLWLGDGSGRVDFALGDGIEKVSGRNYTLLSRTDKGDVYPEIIKIIYLPEEQKMELITRDLRFVESSL